MKPFTESRWSPNLENFQRAMNSEDPLGYFIRLHLEVERHLGQLIEELTPLRQTDFRSFQSKVLVLRAVGIPSWILGWAEKLNKARNKLAHQMNLEPTEIAKIIHELNSHIRKFAPTRLSLSFERDEDGDVVPEKNREAKFMLVSGMMLCRQMAGLCTHENAKTIKALNGNGGWATGE